MINLGGQLAEFPRIAAIGDGNGERANAQEFERLKESGHGARGRRRAHFRDSELCLLPAPGSVLARALWSLKTVSNGGRQFGGQIKELAARRAKGTNYERAGFGQKVFVL